MGKKKSKKQLKSKNESVGFATNVIKAHPFYFGVFAIWSVYIYLTLQAPNTASQQFHISHEVLNLIRLSVAIPYLLIWLAAAYSSIKIKRYAVVIEPSREASAFHQIANGILLLLCSLIISTLASTLRNFFSDDSQMRPMLTILTNYAYIIPYLFAFIYIFRGTMELVSQHVGFKMTLKKGLLYTVPFIVLAYIWLELIFTNQSRVTPSAVNQTATYYLKDSLLILTIVIPALMTWVIGLLTVLKLRMYYQKVSGIIYKRALVSLVYGFIGVISASIFLQALLSLGTQRLLDLGLDKILAVIYLFLFIQALGFFFIAKGANNLTKIETV